MSFPIFTLIIFLKYLYIADRERLPDWVIKDYAGKISRTAPTAAAGTGNNGGGFKLEVYEGERPVELVCIFGEGEP